MWVVKGYELKMTEGDYGVELPVTVHGTELQLADQIKITIKNKTNGDVIISKTYGDFESNTFPFEITQEETALLPVGMYVYSLDWYQNNVFMCNIIPNALLRVVEKI